MTHITLNEPEKCAELDIMEASSCINGEAHMVCPDDDGDLRYYGLRARIENAHDVFMGLIEHYDYMKQTGVPEATIASSPSIQRGVRELKDILRSIIKMGEKVCVYYFDGRDGMVGIHAGFALRGMKAVLESRFGANNPLLSLGFTNASAARPVSACGLN